MTDLAQFLRDRYTERRAIAEAASPWPWKVNPDDAEEVLAHDDILVADVFALSSNQSRNTATFIVANDPADAIADIDAKLALLDDLLNEGHAMLQPGGSTSVYCGADYGTGDPCDCGRDTRVERRLRILAQPFAGHPSYPNTP